MTLLALLRNVLPPLLLLASHSALSACDPVLLRAVHPEVSEYHGGYEACKRIPGREREVVVALAHPSEDPDEDFTLEIALFDEAKSKIVSRYVGTLTNGGGPDLQGIEIDTAKYFLGAGSRAFGIRSRYEMGEVSYSSETLNLFVRSNTNLLRVLADLDVEIMFGTRWAPPPHEFKTRHATRTLQMSPDVAHGFFDIIVVERIMDHDYREEVDGTKVDTLGEEQRSRYRLRFNGDYYDVPVELRHFECRIC